MILDTSCGVGHVSDSKLHIYALTCLFDTFFMSLMLHMIGIKLVCSCAGDPLKVAAKVANRVHKTSIRKKGCGSKSCHCTFHVFLERDPNHRQSETPLFFISKDHCFTHLNHPMKNDRASSFPAHDITEEHQLPEVLLTYMQSLMCIPSN